MSHENIVIRRRLPLEQTAQHDECSPTQLIRKIDELERSAVHAVIGSHDSPSRSISWIGTGVSSARQQVAQRVVIKMRRHVGLGFAISTGSALMLYICGWMSTADSLRSQFYLFAGVCLMLDILLLGSYLLALIVQADN